MQLYTIVLIMQQYLLRTLKMVSEAVKRRNTAKLRSTDEVDNFLNTHCLEQSKFLKLKYDPAFNRNGFPVNFAFKKFPSSSYCQFYLDDLS